MFWTQRGTLMLDARQIRPVGVGELLARLEHLKRILAAEGLFDAERKQPLPFLPRTVGLICGRASAAEKDVVENARRRWPTVRVRDPRGRRCRGRSAVQEVMAALARARPRPGRRRHRHRAGRWRRSRTCCRSATRPWCEPCAAARTPVVCAIGHDVDTPLLDLVADVRASTPTDAGQAGRARRSAEQRAAVGATRARLHRAVRHAGGPSSAGTWPPSGRRPVMADPRAMITARREELDALTARARHRVLATVHRAADQVGHLRAQVRALSPQSTLERGYAVVQHRRRPRRERPGRRRRPTSCCGSAWPVATSACARSLTPRRRVRPVRGAAARGGGGRAGRAGGVGHRS